MGDAERTEWHIIGLRIQEPTLNCTLGVPNFRRLTDTAENDSPSRTRKRGREAATYVQEHNWQHLAAVDRLNHSMLVSFSPGGDSGE